MHSLRGTCGALAVVLCSRSAVVRFPSSPTRTRLLRYNCVGPQASPPGVGRACVPVLFCGLLGTRCCQQYGGIVGDHGGLACLTTVFRGRQGPRSMVIVVARILVGAGGWLQRLLQAGCVGPDVVASGHPVWALSHYTGRRVRRFPSVALPPTVGRVVAPCRHVCGARVWPRRMKASSF